MHFCNLLKLSDTNNPARERTIPFLMSQNEDTDTDMNINRIIASYKLHLDVYREIYLICYNKYNIRVQLSVILHLGLSLLVPILTILGYLYKALIFSIINLTVFAVYIVFKYEECKSHSLDVLHQLDYIEKHGDVLYGISHLNEKHAQFRELFIKQHETFYCNLQRILAEDIASHMMLDSILKSHVYEIDVLLATSHKSHLEHVYNTKSKF